MHMIRKEMVAMGKKVYFINIIILFFFIFPSFNSLSLTYNSTKDLSVYRLVRSSEWITSAVNPVFLPEEKNYGLTPVSGVRIIQIHGDATTSSSDDIMGDRLVNLALSASVLPAIAAYFRVGEGRDMKKDIDENAVVIGDEMMIALSKKFGYIFVLGGAEGPGRDDAPGGKPGTIFYWGGKITPAEMEDADIVRIPKSPQEVIDVLLMMGKVTINEIAEGRIDGIEGGKINGVVVMMIDRVEGTTATAEDQPGANSFISLTVHPVDSDVSIRYLPDHYVLGWTVPYLANVDMDIIRTIKPWDTPMEVLTKWAEAHSMSLEYAANIVNFFFLGGDRIEDTEGKGIGRHKVFMDNLIDMQEDGLSVAYTSGRDFTDGDFVARITASSGEQINGRYVFVGGGSGTIEGFTAFLVANLSGTGGGSGVFMTKHKPFLNTEGGVVAWGELNEVFGERLVAGRESGEATYTPEEVEEYEELGIEKEDIAKPFTEDDVGLLIGGADAIVAFASITGERPHIVSPRLANLLTRVRIEQDGSGGAYIFVRGFFTYGGGQFIVEVPFHTHNLERTKELMFRTRQEEGEH